MKFAPLKNAVDPHRPITYGIVQAGPDTPGGVPYIRPTDMTATAGVVDPEKLLRTTPEIAAAYTRSEIQPGDVVLSIGPSYGKVMVVETALSGANLTQGTARLAPAPGVSGRFLYWTLQSKPARDYWDMAVAGATFRALNLDPLSQTPVPVPPLQQQRQVADFLDEQIDRLNRAITLREHQQKLFSRLVLSEITATLTGRDPTSRQPSGAEWLGDIPSSWSMGPVYAYYDVQLGKMLNEERARGPNLLPYLRNANVQWRGISTDDLSMMHFEPHELSRYGIRAGDLLVCEGGAGVAEAAVWDGSVAPCYFSKSLHRVRPRSYLPVEWLMFWLRVAKAAKVFEAEGNQATIPHLTGEQLQVQRIPVPPRDETSLDALHQRLGALTTLESMLSRSIALLVERKQALITASVTGQFDITTARTAA